MTTVKTFSSESTKKFGEKLAKNILLDHEKQRAVIVALSGDLGSGKTTFVQGFFKGLGIRSSAVSPTFIIMRRTALRGKSTGKFKNMFHVDAYRIKNPKTLGMLEFDEILSNPKNIVIIEWAENIKKILPKKIIWIYFKHGNKEHERTLIYE